MRRGSSLRAQAGPAPLPAVGRAPEAGRDGGGSPGDRAEDPAVLRTGLEVARLLGQRQLRHCILHGWQGPAGYPSSDVDLAVAPADLLRLEEALRHCRTARPVQLLQHEASGYYFVLAARDAGLVRYLTLDAALDYRLAGSVFFPGEDLLRGRWQDTGLWVAAPPTEFGYLLVKKICKKTLPEKQRRRLRALCALLGGEARRIACRLLGTQWGPLVLRAIAQGDWITLEASLPRLKRALWWQGVKRRPLDPVRYWVPELRRRWRRWRYPTGVCVAVLGPDGSGKSTLIRQLREELAGAFRRTALFHVRPPLLRRLRDVAPVTDPHGRAPYPRWLSYLKVGHFALCCSLGYLLRVRPRLSASTLVLFDRYYDDLVVDPRRYRYGGPMGLARLARRLVQRPDLFLVLDAPEEQLRRRKREVSGEELQRQRTGYRQLGMGYRNAVLLDASLPTEVVARQARDTILDYLYRRYMERRPLCFAAAPATLRSVAAALGPPAEQGWPGSTAPARTGSSGPRGRLFGWLSLRSDRGYLIPLESRRAAVKALDLYNAQSLTARFVRACLAGGLRIGMGRHMLRNVELVVPGGGAREGSRGTAFLEYLKQLLRCDELSVAVSLGTPGPHRKPVFLALTRDGDPLAYVKMGGNELTNALVRHEAETLRSLAGTSFGSFTVPDVLHAGWWNERFVCVQSAWAAAGRQRVDDALTPRHVRIVRELAAVHIERQPLEASEFWRATLRQIAALSQTCYGRVLADGARRVEEWFDGVLVPWHFSHGDFAPWNMKVSNEKVFIFDWEHASRAAPPAWDLFHFAFETLRVQRRRARYTSAAFFRDAVLSQGLDDHFARLDLGHLRERCLYLYLLARLASWCVELPEHAAGFAALQDLVHMLRWLEQAV